MLLDDIGAILQTAGVGSTSVNPPTIQLGALQDTPDSCVAVFEYAGAAPVHTMGDGGTPPLEQPRIQVLARAGAQDYQAARALAENAYKALDKLAAQTVNGCLYAGIFALQSPFLLSRDANQRVLIACNYQVYKARS